MIHPVAMQVKIRLRSGTSEEWAAKNPVLTLAEPGYDLTTRTLKVGDGSSAWNDLPVTVTTDQIEAAIANSAAVHHGIHAASHAAGGSDPVTPASIGAVPAGTVEFQRPRGIYPADTHVDTMVDSGSWWISSQWTTANGFPWAGPAGPFGTFTVTRANGASYVVQTIQSSNAWVNTWTRTLRSTAWSAWEAVGPLRGTSSPVGIVSAPRGTEFIDVNATNGAQKWLKTSDTGSSGWIVTDGDTGWRAVDWLGNGVTNTRYTIQSQTAKRVGDRITLAFQITPVEVGYTQHASAIPVGFRLTAPQAAVAQTLTTYPAASNNPAVGAMGCNSSGTTTVQLVDVPASRTIYGQLEWTTSQAWPTTLPGTPA